MIFPKFIQKKKIIIFLVILLLLIDIKKLENGQFKEENKLN